MLWSILLTLCFDVYGSDRNSGLEIVSPLQLGAAAAAATVDRRASSELNVVKVYFTAPGTNKP